MEILLIGNGFDLAHKLPTQYKDFLKFCDNVGKIYDEKITKDIYQIIYLDKWEFDEEIKTVLLKTFGARTLNNVKGEDKNILEVSTQYVKLGELYFYIKDNTWINYFLKNRTLINENWIDFESEISKVIQVLDETRKLFDAGESINDLSKKQSKVMKDIVNASKISGINVWRDLEGIDNFVNSLATDLNRLTRALEIYLAEFVSKIEIKTENKISEIEELAPDHVLSFNYTDTYEKIYGVEKDIEYDYIHGEASVDENIDTCNLVLGIDEYLLDDRKDKEIEFVTFKKYYQRIYKGTGGKYLDWVSVIKNGYRKHRRIKKAAHDRLGEILKNGNMNELVVNDAIKTLEEEPTKHNLYIFGHSLDVTDKDIIKPLICNDNVYTKIYYYRKTEDDKRTLGRLITNLIKVIGQEELIRRTGGPMKTIEFVPQKVNVVDEKRL